MSKTILLTGGTGYLGQWLAKILLEKGYILRLTVRDKKDIEKYQDLVKIASKQNTQLEIWEADLLEEGSFIKAAEGADAIIHMASPFTLRYKDAQKELIDPALKGTRNVLRAANQSGSVKKVVLTSSIAAMMGDNIDLRERGIQQLNESYFNESSSATYQPYQYSKVLAEKEAWKINKAQNQWKLVVINPSFVLGPSLSQHSNSESLVFMSDILNGKYRMGAPDLKFGFVDTRDVAQAHLLALENENAEGRYLLAERSASVLDLVDILKNLYGNKFKLPLMKAPKWLVYIVCPMFGLERKFVKRNVGYNITLDTTKSLKQLGLEYRPLEQTISDMVNQLEKDGLLK